LNIENSASLILASASPRRAELLRSAGFQFVVRLPAIDESVRHGEEPRDYVLRLAVEKAGAVTREVGDVVLAADTTVVVDDEILGKPIDDADAVRMVRRLAGRSHQVLSGVCVLSGDGVDARLAVTDVEFGPMDDDEIAWYVATGEPMDKAGAYGIQGACSRFIVRVNGSYSNVVGLPIAVVYDMLKRLHVPHQMSLAKSGE
jgi:septum formation protein